MMAVQLHRALELLLCSPEFQLGTDQNDAELVPVHDHELDHDQDHDLDLSDNHFDDPQKPRNFDSSDYNELSSHSSESDIASSIETETETDNNNSSNNKKDDYCIAELTRYMTRDPEKTKEGTWDLGGWRYTTQLCLSFGSSYGSTEGSTSQEATPPATPEIEKRHVWDSNNFDNNITASMEKMNIVNQSLPRNKPASVNPIVLEDPTPDQIRAFQFYRLKQELLLRQQSSANKVNQRILDQLNERDLQHVKKEKGHPCEGGSRQPRTNWANQQQKGSGMQAVFLGGSGPKRGSTGTGVFLPCVIGTTPHSRKKKGCSPVLIPAKVMQALKVHFDRMDNLSRQNAANFPMHHDTYKAAHDGRYSQRMRVTRAVPTMTTQNDMGLPQDWTY